MDSWEKSPQYCWKNFYTWVGDWLLCESKAKRWGLWEAIAITWINMYPLTKDWSCHVSVYVLRCSESTRTSLVQSDSFHQRLELITILQVMSLGIPHGKKNLREYSKTYGVVDRYDLVPFTRLRTFIKAIEIWKIVNFVPVLLHGRSFKWSIRIGILVMFSQNHCSDDLTL